MRLTTLLHLTTLMHLTTTVWPLQVQHGAAGRAGVHESIRSVWPLLLDHFDVFDHSAAFDHFHPFDHYRLTAPQSRFSMVLLSVLGDDESTRGLSLTLLINAFKLLVREREKERECLWSNHSIKECPWSNYYFIHPKKMSILAILWPFGGPFRPYALSSGAAFDQCTIWPVHHLTSTRFDQYTIWPVQRLTSASFDQHTIWPVAAPERHGGVVGAAGACFDQRIIWPVYYIIILYYLYIILPERHGGVVGAARHALRGVQGHQREPPVQGKTKAIIIL
jgi:hypothetical protein